ncbi:MAG TPA: hypothetical protein VMR95_01390 [Candidatus Binatia bacterium]|nr:hypothetical protein [Candidatus Binatia bacterium]
MADKMSANFYAYLGTRVRLRCRSDARSDLGVSAVVDGQPELSSKVPGRGVNSDRRVVGCRL